MRQVKNNHNQKIHLLVKIYFQNQNQILAISI